MEVNIMSIQWHTISYGSFACSGISFLNNALSFNTDLKWNHHNQRAMICDLDAQSLLRAPSLIYLVI